MENLLHFLLFSGFWMFIQSISNQFLLIQENKTWDDAQAYCKKYHIDLATIASSEDQTSVREAVSPALPPLAWTGLGRSNNTWRWKYHDVNVTFIWKVSLSFWKPGQPDNSDTKSECGVISASGWDDIACDQMFPFFCINESIAEKFVFIPQNKSRGDAWTYCAQYHRTLATIYNQTENDLMVNMMVGYEKAWVSLSKEWWWWSDGTSMNTLTWSAGQPNITGPNPLCGATTLDGFDDRLCSETLPFICLRHTKQQIMRVELKSSQNLNDPAVMETILQLIQQKLKDRMIGNDTTLTWRVQPDGNVFSSKHESEVNQKLCPHTFF
ncbi:macrophage mannose receptor 1-like [Misgurnus anguillicaudatus]|uniref:macrophage mannose receptor 1-like n=1 Tax=Misgurnus anguillicaudatus TaxID=75329 RepID=UPI003CCF41EA